jgi:putative peptidoglycan lipid II flippase
MIAAFLREMSCALMFGAGRQMDLFLYAYLIYDLLLPAARDIPSALQGRLRDYEGAQLASAFRIVLRICITTGAAIGVACVLYFGLLKAPDLGSSLTPTQWWLMVTILAVGTFLLATQTAVCAQHVHKGNTAYQLYQPLVLNLAMLACILLLTPVVGVMSMAWGVLIGTALLLALQLRSAPRMPRTCERDDATIAKAQHRNLLPVIGFVVVQALGSKGSLLVERSFGLALPYGSVSLINYAVRLWGIPISLFVVAATLPLIPIMARAHARGDYDHIYRVFCQTVIGLLVAFICINTLLSVYAHEIVALVFERGVFTHADTQSVVDLLRILLTGSFGAALATISTRALWIFNRSMETALITWSCVALYFASCFPLVEHFGISGLAIGNSIHYNLQALLSLALLRSTLKKQGWRNRSVSPR